MSSRGHGRPSKSMFMNKLWDVVNEESTDKAIRWSPDGDSIIVCTDPMLWMRLTGSYFKHSNISSFIRQLNMYNFNKIVPERYPCSQLRNSMFSNPNFQRGHPEMLPLITRKQTAPSAAALKLLKEKAAGAAEKTTTVAASANDDDDRVEERLKDVRNEMAQFKTLLEETRKEVELLKNENVALWRELFRERSLHRQQSKVTKQVFQYLVSLVDHGGSPGSNKQQKMALMINDAPSHVRKAEDRSTTGPTIYELQTEVHAPAQQTFDPDLTVLDEECAFEPEMEDGERLEDLLSSGSGGSDPPEIAQEKENHNVDEMLNMNTTCSVPDPDYMPPLTDDLNAYLNNLIFGKYNANVLSNSNKPQSKHEDFVQCKSDSLKQDLLTANTVDASHLLGLFHSSDPVPGPSGAGASLNMYCYSPKSPQYSGLISDALVLSDQISFDESPLNSPPDELMDIDLVEDLVQ